MTWNSDQIQITASGQEFKRSYLVLTHSPQFDDEPKEVLLVLPCITAETGQSSASALRLHIRLLPLELPVPSACRQARPFGIGQSAVSGRDHQVARSRSCKARGSSPSRSSRADINLFRCSSRSSWGAGSRLVSLPDSFFRRRTMLPTEDLSIRTPSNLASARSLI